MFHTRSQLTLCLTRSQCIQLQFGLRLGHVPRAVRLLNRPAALAVGEARQRQKSSRPCRVELVRRFPDDPHSNTCAAELFTTEPTCTKMVAFPKTIATQQEVQRRCWSTNRSCLVLEAQVHWHSSLLRSHHGTVRGWRCGDCSTTKENVCQKRCRGLQRSSVVTGIFKYSLALRAACSWRATR